jgi:thioredoxin reductase (NADPH)
LGTGAVLAGRGYNALRPHRLRAMTTPEDTAFPSLIVAEIDLIREQAAIRTYQDGEFVFRAGDDHINLFVVESGLIEIQNPSDDHRVIATHDARAFAGDIDLLTGRPVIVDAVARGETRLLVVPHGKIHALLNRVPSLGEKLIRAFLARREQLVKSERVGLQVVGENNCRQTNLLCEFLYKNSVPYHWTDPQSDLGKHCVNLSSDGNRLPQILLGNGQYLITPSLAELAQATGVWRRIAGEHVQLAIIGAGPAGIAASVYAASEGIQTLLIDRIGPGG